MPFAAGPGEVTDVKIGSHRRPQTGLAPKTWPIRVDRVREGTLTAGSGYGDGLSVCSRQARFDWHIPCQFDVPSNGSLIPALPTSVQRIGRLEAVSGDLLPQRVALPADPDRVVAELRTEGPLDEQDGLEGGDVDIIIYTSEPPADALTSRAVGLVDLLTVRALEHHVAGAVRSQLDPQVLRLHQPLQDLQEHAVLLGQLHVVSP